MKPTIYISGPMEKLEKEIWRKYRDMATERLKKEGFDIFDPACKDSLLEDAGLKLVSQDIIGLDKAEMELSDIILIDARHNVAAWGTCMETYIMSEKNKIGVAFGKFKDRPPFWLEGHTDVVMPTLDDALDIICVLCNTDIPVKDRLTKEVLRKYMGQGVRKSALAKLCGTKVSYLQRLINEYKLKDEFPQEEETTEDRLKFFERKYENAKRLLELHKIRVQLEEDKTLPKEENSTKPTDLK